MSAFASNTRQFSKKPSVLREKLPKGTLHGRTGKCWSKIFSKPRFCNDRAVSEDHVNWVDVTEDENERESSNDATSDVVRQPEDREHRPFEQEAVNILLGSLEVSNALWETKALAKFLVRRDDEASVAEDDQAWAWVDDRDISGGRSRDYSCSFDARGLKEILENPRFGHSTLRNVDQRMIYISKLTPSFVSSLAKTVWYHQVEALRDAIRKHITLESSLRVHVPTLGFNTYRLEFHMSYLLLRQSPQAANTTTDGSIVSLSFLELTNADDQVVPHSIYQGHMSLVICGWSDLQWTGYAFTRNDSDHANVVESDERRKYLVSQYGFDFAIPGKSAQSWDARRYWLRLVARHSQYVLGEWLYLVRTIEEGIRTWKSQDPCNGVTTQGSLLVDDIKNFLDRTVQTIRLLQQLRDTLSVTVQAYKRFAKSDGDRCYFSDITDCSSMSDSIFQSSEKLTDLLLRLISLADSCERFATHLDHMIALENNMLIMQSNQLDQESNMYHAASNRLKERINELHEERIILTKEILKLNEKENEAACASLAEATKTSRSTRVNIELLLLTTPLAVVLQYFSSEQEIIFFKRSPTTLVLATLILMLLLRVLMLAIQHGGTLLRLVFRKPSAQKKISQPSNVNMSDAVELTEMRNV